MTRGPFTISLDNLGLPKVSHKQWVFSEPNTFIDGSIPIDGVCVSKDLELRGLKILPFSESVGDHRTMIFDVTSRSLLGKFEQQVVRDACRHLNTKTPSLSRYNTILIEQISLHNMDQILN